MSHPVWVRGLKHFLHEDADGNGYVAPRVGAWIETKIREHGRKKRVCVAPRVGAWIETTIARRTSIAFAVAPRVGAWIETDKWVDFDGCIMSHPVWVRGLKQ